VLAGCNKIPIVCFEAEEAVDSGNIYLKDYIELDGTELLDEIKFKQAKKTCEIVHDILNLYPNLKSFKQVGKSSYYKKRTKKDDQIDINKSLKEIFNHFRIVDNEKFPAWFDYQGEKYIMKIYKGKKK
jgi:methionyl-tRNA formyltransferase